MAGTASRRRARVTAGAFALSGLLLVFAGRATGQRLAVADLGGGGDEAGAATLLLRSMLTSAARPVVPIGRLASAIVRVDPTHRGLLIVEPAQVAPLLKELGADRLVEGTVERADLEVTLSWRAYDERGALLGGRSVRAPRGELAALTLAAARQMAPLVGVEVDVRPQATLGELRPFARAAQALADGDPSAAAEALATVDRDVASRVSAARELADVIVNDHALPPQARMAAAINVGESKAALQVASESPPSIEIRAQAARARLLDDDLPRAERELASMKREHGSSALALARCELAYRKGKQADLERELEPLLDKTPPDPAALAFVATLKAGALSPSLEALALTAAQRVALTQPSVAGAVGLRAARGGDHSREAIQLVRPDDVSRAQVQQLSSWAPANTAEARTFQSNLEARSRSAEPVAQPIADEPATAAPARTGATATKAPSAAAAIPDGEQVAEIGDYLAPLLEAFPPLAERSHPKDPHEPRPPLKAVIARVAGSEPPWSLHAVNAPLLRGGLKHVLSGALYSLNLAETATDLVAPERTRSAMAKLGSSAGADLVVLFRLSAVGPDAKVELTLYDGRSQSAFEYTGELPGGRTGLVTTNPLLLPLAILLVALLGAWIFFSVIRTGSLAIEIKPDPAGENAAIALELKRSAQAPRAPADATAYHRATLARGPRKGRRKQQCAPLRTRFTRVPPGTWYLHLYGTQEKGGEIRPLPDLSQKVEVVQGQELPVTLDLDTHLTDYRVRVVEGPPVPNARVWVDDKEELAFKTDDEGRVVLSLPRGPHLVHLDAREVRVSRKIDVVRGKVQDLTFDLAWERKAKSREGGIEVAAHDASLEAELVTVPVKIQIPDAARRPATVVAAPAPVARRYTRVAELGRGAMGVVYRGRDTVLERDVAIKIISEEVRSNPMALEMFFQEAKAMAALNHPNLVTVFDQGQDGNETFLVMEFIDGVTLEQLLERRRSLSVPEALQIVDQVAAGLGYAHGRRILHRDIKPANIFVADGGVVKIGDFGLARAVRQARLTQTKVCGTPMYMAPEQIRGSGVDFRSDLYSVGCTLFEMLTGRPPFVEGEVMYHHMHTPPPAPSSIDARIPRPVDALVLGLLEKNLELRTPTAEALRAALKPLRALFSTDSNAQKTG